MVNKIFIVNAPVIFWACWKLIKFWVDKNTRKKIIIFTNNGK